ncbi:neuroguidin [Chrysoperla carnea]|uniref:neuroguidin n=1 Tax=Chrysoperla carnea TaxID=189513 RepID=UPI001D06D4AC|nr:neuroguidin [Chrysoperla carnea]
MVQAINEDFDEDQEDVSQALALLREMNTNVQNVAQLVDNMIVKVHKGELSTTQGLSFLEMKYHMLLSYLINVTYAILRKCSGETIEGDPSIDRLVEIRTVLEKIRPIDHRLKYQIDKLVKAAVQGTVEENDPSMLRANPDNLLGNDGASSEESDDEEEGTKEKKSKSGLYVPPKLAAVHYDGDESIVEKNKRLQENKRKHTLHSSVIEDLRDEYLDTPQEISHGNYAQKTLSRFEQEKTEYEENYLTRLPETKVERNRRKQLHSNMGNLADEIVYGHSSSNSKSLKRKRQSNKIKKKSGGKKRRTQ